MRGGWLVCFVAACSAPAAAPVQQPEPPTPTSLDAAVPEPVAADAATAPMPTPAPTALPGFAAPTFPSTRPVVPGPGTRLPFDGSIVLGGVTIKAPRAKTQVVLEFVSPNGKPRTVRFVNRPEAEAEIAYDSLFVARAPDADGVEIVLATTPSPAALDCTERILEEAKRLQLAIPASPQTGGHGDGFVTMKGRGWRGHCGMFSGRIWFDKLEVPPMLEKADPRPAVRGAKQRLQWQKSIALGGGTTLKFTGRSHAHRTDGGALGMWSFEATRGGKTAPIHLSSEDEQFEAEADALGTLVVFRHVGYETFDVIVVGKSPKQPIDCEAKIDAAVAKRKLPDGGSRGGMEQNGFLDQWSESWTAHCGTLTGRLWFEPPRE